MPAAPPRCGTAAARLPPPPRSRRQGRCLGGAGRPAALRGCRGCPTAPAPLPAAQRLQWLYCGGSAALALLSLGGLLRRRASSCSAVIVALPAVGPLLRRGHGYPTAATPRTVETAVAAAPAAPPRCGAAAARLPPLPRSRRRGRCSGDAVPPPVPRTVARPRLLRRPHSSPAGAAADVYVELFPLRL